MNFLLGQLLLLLGSSFANVIAQWIGFRVVKGMTLVVSTIYGFFFGMVTLWSLELVTLVFAPVELSEVWPMIIVNTVIFGAGSYAYFQLLNIGDASLRIRIIREIDAAPNGCTEEEIIRSYGAEQIINTRLERLVSVGQIVKRDERLFLGKPGLIYVAKLFRFLKILILGRGAVAETPDFGNGIKGRSNS